MKISIIGAGHVANQMTPKLYEKGHSIHQVYNRGITKARKLAKKVKAVPVSDLSKLDKNIDLILIMVSDIAIESIAHKLSKHFKNSKTLIAHTSGSISSTALKTLENYGVFYPLQTFRNIKASDWDHLPILYTANSSKNKTKLKQLAESLNLKATQKSNKQRKALHLSAVIVNNFINHLFCLNGEWLEKNNSDFDLLIPLINKTISNASESDACKIQTGPALRKDQAVINDHIKSLDGLPELQELYKVFSHSIQTKHS